MSSEDFLLFIPLEIKYPIACRVGCYLEIILVGIQTRLPCLPVARCIAWISNGIYEKYESSKFKIN